MLATLRRLRHGPFKGLDPLWLVLGRLYRKAARRVPGLTVRQNIGPYGPFRLLPEFTFSDLEHWGGAHNRGFGVCVEACRGRTCVLDVGAHVGLVTLPAAAVMAPGGRLYAFEPADANAGILRRHLALNGAGNVELVQALVGAADADAVDFYESLGPHGQNAVVLKGDKTLIGEHGGYRRARHPQVSLDGFCAARTAAPEIIKIDVEGAEIDVLRGARDVIMRHKPLIFLSIHPREIGLMGQRVEELVTVIAELGYALSDIAGQRVDAPRAGEYLMAPVGQARPSIPK